MAIIPAIVLALALAACSEPAPPPAAGFGGPTMGTTWSVTLGAAPAGVAVGTLQAGVAAVLERVNARMSTWRDDSELSRFNSATGTGWHPVSEETARVVAEALRVGALSGGAFDVTVGPLVNLWGFGPGGTPARVPDAAAIGAARERVGQALLEVRASPPALRKRRADVYVDLSAIAKGYGVDAVAAWLDRRGIESYLVEIGGELRARGSKADGTPWRVAVERPVPGQSRSIQRIVGLADAGIATSGDYRNYFESEGRRYSHTIDPRTGRPIEHRLASASVVHSSTMTADALATTLMVLGPDSGLAFARARGLAAHLLVKTADGFEERLTPAFENLSIE